MIYFLVLLIFGTSCSNRGEEHVKNTKSPYNFKENDISLNAEAMYTKSLIDNFKNDGIPKLHRLNSLENYISLFGKKEPFKEMLLFHSTLSEGDVDRLACVASLSGRREIFEYMFGKVGFDNTVVGHGVLDAIESKVLSRVFKIILPNVSLAKGKKERMIFKNKYLLYYLMAARCDAADVMKNLHEKVGQFNYDKAPCTHIKLRDLKLAAMSIAAAFGSAEVVSNLLETYSYHEMKEAALAGSVVGNKVDLLRILKNKRISLDLILKTKKGKFTPLSLASRLNNLDMVKFLVDSGAVISNFKGGIFTTLDGKRAISPDPNFSNNQLTSKGFCPPLEQALLFQNEEVSEYLIGEILERGEKIFVAQSEEGFAPHFTISMPKSTIITFGEDGEDKEELNEELMEHFEDELLSRGWNYDMQNINDTEDYEPYLYAGCSYLNT